MAWTTWRQTFAWLRPEAAPRRRQRRGLSLERLEDRAVLALVLPVNAVELVPLSAPASVAVAADVTGVRFSSNNAAIAAAVAKVPTSVGALTTVTVVDFGTSIYTGSLDVTNTLNRIRSGGRSISSNDGAVYSNGNGALSPRSGTWFEFVVDPRTGTNRSFSSVNFPGPMRVLLNTDGTTYFTGNHYTSFVSLWKPGSAPVPSIGTMTVSPARVTVGGAFTLTAGNVAETGGTVTGVKFYRDTNGTAGLQVGTDTFVGAGVRNGSTWTFTTSADSLSSGAYTFFAVAGDAAGTSSAAVSTVLTVANPPTPVIGAFTASPASIVAGGSVTLTAANVTEPGGSISGVTFYRETNGLAGLQAGSDTAVGAGTASGSTWSLVTSTAGLAAGAYTYYAVAADPANATTTAATVVAVTNPLAPATPSVSLAAATLLEGNSGVRLMTFVVSLTAPATTATTVRYRTLDDTATAGLDYEGVTSGLVSFRPGQRTATIAVRVSGDAVIEADEMFRVELFGPVNATLGISVATGTILNDDVALAAALSALQPPPVSNAGRRIVQMQVEHRSPAAA